MKERIGLAPDLERIRLVVANTSDRVIRVSSHYPFWRTNRRLEFDRAAAHGSRLDVPAGASVRFAPGETKDVVLETAVPTSGIRAKTAATTPTRAAPLRHVRDRFRRKTVGRT